jgi:catalase (peroxidase I)
MILTLALVAVPVLCLNTSLAVQTLESFLIVNETTKACVGDSAPNWLRTAFHDAGTFYKIGNSGGADESIVNELNFPINAGINPLPT